MTKAVRIVLVIAVLIGIVLVARNQIAWAGFAPDHSSSNSPLQQQPANLGSADADPGSVKPPPVVVPPITGPGTYSAGGVCTIVVDQLSSAIAIHAVLLPFSTLHNKPAEINRYIAGVCNVTFVRRPGGVTTDITAQDGSVKVCFAGIPNASTKIYFYNDKTWTALDTTAAGGLVCAPATKTGKYVLAKLP